MVAANSSISSGKAAISMYCAEKPVTSPSSSPPAIMLPACGTMAQPSTTPRWATGTWSGTTGESPAPMIMKLADSTREPSATPATVVWMPMQTSATMQTSEPAIIHGRRRPNRLVVRSLRAPASGARTIPEIAPIMLTQA